MKEVTRQFKGARLVALVLASCSLGSASKGGFVNVTGDSGIDYQQWAPPPDWVKLAPQVMTGGAAVADFDQDGWPDLFVTRYRSTDLLYRNRGDGTFEDVSELAGFDQVTSSNGAAWGDIDNDGDADLYVSVVDESPEPLHFLLYLNQGDGTFAERSHLWGVDQESPNLHSGFSVCFGDYNRDGLLDLHSCQWGVRGAGNRSLLLMNRGPVHGFEDVTLNAGVELWDDPESDEGPDMTTWAFTSRITDLDRDGWPDLVVAGDYGTSRLFWNQGDGTFVDGTEQAQIGGEENGMGLAVGDYDGDGLADLFFTSIFDDRPNHTPVWGWGPSGNRLYRNQGGRRFEDVTTASGVRDGGWGWGAVFFDYDNDGDLDLVMTNGFESDFLSTETPFHLDPTTLWRNDDGVFTDVSVEMGITDRDKGKGVLVFDYDQDGDLDLFIVNNNGFPILYRNDLESENHWLRVRTRGRFSNRDGIGAVVTLERGDGRGMQHREINGGSHYLTQSEKVAHFGLGDSMVPVSLLKVRWPSGIEQRLHDVSVDQVIEVVEPESPYLAWLAQYFTQAEIDSGVVTDPIADPDRDGRSNLLEFGTGTHPGQPEQSSPVEILDAPAANGTLIRFRQRSLPRGVQVFLESSPDLEGWRTVPGEHLEIIDTEATDDWGVEVVTAKVSGAVAFLRMRVDLGN